MKTVEFSTAVWKSAILEQCDFLRNITSGNSPRQPGAIIAHWKQVRRGPQVEPGDVPLGNLAVRTLKQLLAATESRASRRSKGGAQ